jgi:hypothetical protein
MSSCPRRNKGAGAAQTAGVRRANAYTRPTSHDGALLLQKTHVMRELPRNEGSVRGA